MTHETDDEAAGANAPAAAASEEWPDRADAPAYAVTLWPNRSLDASGRRILFVLLGIGLTLPLVPAIGTPVFWGLVPFAVAAFVALRYAFGRNNRDGRLVERLELWPDEMRVERREPSGQVRRWRADPYWVRLTLHPDSRPENYLTLKGGGREIELGAFLSPEERGALAEEIEGEIRRLLRGGSPGRGTS